jgi:hypothetical protein
VKTKSPIGIKRSSRKTLPPGGGGGGGTAGKTVIETVEME